MREEEAGELFVTSESFVLRERFRSIAPLEPGVKAFFCALGLTVVKGLAGLVTSLALEVLSEDSVSELTFSLLLSEVEAASFSSATSSKFVGSVDA